MINVCAEGSIDLEEKLWRLNQKGIASNSQVGRDVGRNEGESHSRKHLGRDEGITNGMDFSTGAWGRVAPDESFGVSGKSMKARSWRDTRRIESPGNGSSAGCSFLAWSCRFGSLHP
jgi:hypothetical protein